MDIIYLDFKVLVKAFHGKPQRKIHRHRLERGSAVTDKTSQEKTDQAIRTNTQPSTWKNVWDTQVCIIKKLVRT